MPGQRGGVFASLIALRFNRIMTKTQKELAFLRDLYIDEQWTLRFTDLVDKHIGFAKEEKLLT